MTERNSAAFASEAGKIGGAKWLTKREYFAAVALQMFDPTEDLQGIVGKSVVVADMLIDALNSKEAEAAYKSAQAKFIGTTATSESHYDTY